MRRLQRLVPTCHSLHDSPQNQTEAAFHDDQFVTSSHIGFIQDLCQRINSQVTEDIHAKA